MARFSWWSGPVVMSTSGPYALEEPFGSAFSIVAAPDCTASKLSNWKTMATFGVVSLPLQSTAMKNAREFLDPGPLSRGDEEKAHAVYKDVALGGPIHAEDVADCTRSA